MKTNRLNRVWRARELTGADVRRLRRKAELTLRELDSLTGVRSTQLSLIERGEVAVGAEVATRLADAFNLCGKIRDQFLFQAASTRSRDKLVGYARRLDPEIVNFLPKVLQEQGVDLEDIRHCQFRPTALDPLRGGAPEEPVELLVVQLTDGRKIGCSVVMVEVK